MPLLILRCMIAGNSLGVQVLHQDGAISRNQFHFTASNGFIIRSAFTVELNKGELYVRGSERDHDLLTSTRTFRTPLELVITLNDLQVAVGELSQHFKA